MGQCFGVDTFVCLLILASLLLSIAFSRSCHSQNDRSVCLLYELYVFGLKTMKRQYFDRIPACECCFIALICSPYMNI